jgi:hypothetical protein
MLLQAELCIEQTQFLQAEGLFERVCYEAASIVRTRTNKLVDVSTKTKEGINRVCKLIAISAYRLCELRSGCLAEILTRRITKMLAKQEPEPILEDEIPHATRPKKKTEIARKARLHYHQRMNVSPVPPESVDAVSELPVTPNVYALCHYSVPRLPKTTRLEPALATELAINNGLLAMRLPCASPVPEWNIRLDTMLLRLFAETSDITNALWCIRRIQGNCNVVLKEAKAKNKTPQRWQGLEVLMTYLTNELKPGASRSCFRLTADKCQEVISALWGDRLVPKKGYLGLIWTFRWAG